MEATLNEAIQFFKEEKGLKRLLEGLAEKYKKWGEFKGTIKLSQVSMEEAMALGYWFRQMNFTEGLDYNIRCFKFLEIYQKTRFASHDLVTILSEIGSEVLVPKSKIIAKQLQYQQKILDEARLFWSHNDWQKIIDLIQNKKEGSRVFTLLLSSGKNSFLTMLKKLSLVLKSLPSDDEFIPVFANRILGDPHALDFGEPLARCLQVVLEQKLYPHPDLWQKFHLLRDDVLNYVSCYGLILKNETEFSGEGPHWTFFASKQKEITNITLETLKNSLHCYSLNQGPIYIVENSSVFSHLVKSVRRYPSFKGALVCFHGWPKQASWTLLEKLHQASKSPRIYYGGDLDPAGIGIANKIWSYSPKTINLWFMSDKVLKLGLGSTTKKSFYSTTLIDSLTNPDLISLTRYLQKNQQTLFQESLLDHYLEHLKNSDS